MSIVKILFLTGALAIGAHNIQAYNAPALKEEITILLHFTDSLYRYPSKSAQEAAYFLQQVTSSCSHPADFDDNDIITLSKIICSYESYEKKIADILNVQAKKAEEKIEHTQKCITEQQKWSHMSHKEKLKNQIAENEYLSERFALNYKLAIMWTALITSGICIFIHDTYKNIKEQIQNHRNILLNDVQQMINKTINKNLI